MGYGREAMMRFWQKKINMWYLLIVILAFLLNGWFDLCCYWNYQDKMDILEHMAQGGASGTDMAAALLKSEHTGEGSGQRLLEQLGYAGSSQNRYYMDFLKQCLTAAVSSAVLLAVVFFTAVLREKQRQRGWEAYLQKTARCLMLFREGAGHGQGNLWENFFSEEMKEGMKESGSAGAEALRVNDQLKMLEEYLSMIQEQAKEEKEKTKRMVTDISHQLKTPAAALDTCLTVLGDASLSDAERLEFYQRCVNELNGLKTLLDSLLQISRMETGMIRIDRQRMPLLDTILAAVNRIYPKASAKKMEFVFDYEKIIEDLAVMQDVKWLCEAFINILDNAVKYSPAGSKILITLQRRSSFVRIEIADQGIGISSRDYHKVFQRFYRGSDSRVESETGSGVGLYLVREIIQRHYGNVFVKYCRSSGKEYPGSTFVVQLPMG